MNPYTVDFHINLPIDYKIVMAFYMPKRLVVTYAVFSVIAP